MERQYTEKDDKLRARFTSWLTTLLRRTRIDYLRRSEREPKTITITELFHSSMLNLCAQMVEVIFMIFQILYFLLSLKEMAILISALNRSSDAFTAEDITILKKRSRKI